MSNTMQFQDMLKFQLMSNMGASMMGGHHHSPNHKQMSAYDIMMQMLMMFLFNIIEDICKAVPVIINTIQTRARSLMSNKMQSALENVSSGLPDVTLKDNSILLDKRHNINRITMMRLYAENNTESKTSVNVRSNEQCEMNLMVDALLAHVAGLDNIPTLRLNPNGQFMVAYRDKPIQISDDIFMKIENFTNDNSTGFLTSIKITLLSNNKSASEISAFIRQVYKAHQENLRNALGKNIYFFDQKIKDVGPPPIAVGMGQEQASNHKRMMIQTAPKNLSFTMTPFYSNKRFCNIFGNDVRRIQKRVEFFLNNKAWYDSKGIPYQLGMLLSGKPGTGKTSIIRAIANLTKRHIVNVNFATITTASQLKNLFYNDRIVVYTDSSCTESKSYYIPIEQRLYVLEEIDAIGDVVKQRTSDKIVFPKDVVPDELTLADILTVLDGTMEIPGRMIIMTSNHPETLDKALLRPGRIDLKADFQNASRDLFIEMFKAYLEFDFPANLVHMLPDNTLTPAEAGELIMKYCNSDMSEEEIVKGILENFPAQNTYLRKSPKPENLHEEINNDENTHMDVSQDPPKNVTNTAQEIVPALQESGDDGIVREVLHTTRLILNGFNLPSSLIPTELHSFVQPCAEHHQAEMDHTLAMVLTNTSSKNTRDIMGSIVNFISQDDIKKRAEVISFRNSLWKEACLYAEKHVSLQTTTSVNTSCVNTVMTQKNPLVVGTVVAANAVTANAVTANAVSTVDANDSEEVYEKQPEKNIVNDVDNKDDHKHDNDAIQDEAANDTKDTMKASMIVLHETRKVLDSVMDKVDEDVQKIEKWFSMIKMNVMLNKDNYTSYKISLYAVVRNGDKVYDDKTIDFLEYLDMLDTIIADNLINCRFHKMRSVDIGKDIPKKMVDTVKFLSSVAQEVLNTYDDKLAFAYPETIVRVSYTWMNNLQFGNVYDNNITNFKDIINTLRTLQNEGVNQDMFIHDLRRGSAEFLHTILMTLKLYVPTEVFREKEAKNFDKSFFQDSTLGCYNDSSMMYESVF